MLPGVAGFFILTKKPYFVILKSFVMKTFLYIVLFVMTVTTSFGRSLYKIEGNNVIVDLEGIGAKSRMLKVEVWSDKTVKIISGMKTEFSTFQSFIPSIQPLPLKFKVGYVQNNIEITTRDLSVSIQEDGLVRIFNREGNKMLIESDRFFEPINANESGYKIKQRYFLNVHENIFGFGFDDSKPRYNLRGSTLVLQQNPTSIAMPVMFSEKGYAIIWDNYSQTTFNDPKSGLEIGSDVADEIQYFFVYGPDWNTLIEEIRNLSGSVPMLPRWAFGHWGFPEFYKNEEARKSKVSQYNVAGFPAESTSTLDVELFQEEKMFTGDGIKERLRCLPAYPSMKNHYIDKGKTVFDRRLCIPTYTNYPGIQGFGTFLIAGESKPTWESMKNQVSAGINLPLSGQPYWSTIIGGSQPLESVNSIDGELLARWYQFAAFTPVFMLPKPDRDIFTLKQPNLSVAAANAIQLRYHLLPYIYAIAADVSFSNKTFTKSLLFDYQKIEKTHQIDQQYLFGESMMICPVTAPMVSQLPVYFPPDSAWYDFFTGKKYDGDMSQSVEVSLDHIPVFVKSGSIIPFATIGSNTIDSLASPMEIRIYPGKNANFDLYEDANDGNGYRNQQFSKIPIAYKEKDRSVSVGPTEGLFPGMIAERIFRVVLVSDSSGIGNQMSGSYKEIIYKGKKVKVKL
jgi:alpha-glucosidase (family GH31 glycosyl hydrolase)